MGAFDSLPPLAEQGRCAKPKPARGTAKLERQMNRADIDKQEDKNKAVAKKRDGKCRLPFCPWCAVFEKQVHAGAHVLHAKGMGGDPSLSVSQPEHLMRLCHLSHMAQENHDWAVEPLTDRGTDGPCEFYIMHDVFDRETGNFSTLRLLWARETAVGVVDLPHPRVKGWQPIRRTKKVV
jgi:hypothetical protein